MSRNWKRVCRLIIAGQSSGFDVSEMRIYFRIKHAILPQPKTLEARIYNLRPSTARAIQALHEIGYVQLDAGYEDNVGTIFRGNLAWVNIGRESPTDTYVDIFAGESDAAFNMSVVNKTFKAGSTPQDHYNEILNQFGKFGVKKGIVGYVDLTQPKYPRAVTLIGMTVQALRTLALSKDAMTYVQDAKLHIVHKDRSAASGEVTLNSSTGLIGMPVETPEGIKIRALINPQINFNTRLKVDQNSINRASPVWGAGGGSLISLPDWQARTSSLATADGIYKIVYYDIEGDTRGIPWYIDMTCVGLINGNDTYVRVGDKTRDPANAEGPASTSPPVPPGSYPGGPPGNPYGPH
jgi:hypothetical protein